MQVVRWFREEVASQMSGDRLELCRAKNKFAKFAAVEDGYRDVSLSVLFSHRSSQRIIGEVQIPPALFIDVISDGNRNDY